MGRKSQAEMDAQLASATTKQQQMDYYASKRKSTIALYVLAIMATALATAVAFAAAIYYFTKPTLVHSSSKACYNSWCKPS